MSKVSESIKHIKDNIGDVCTRIGRNPEQVKLVVVTKSATVEAVKEVINLGYTDLGENRVQQLKKVSTQIAEFLENADSESALRPKVIGI